MGNIDLKHFFRYFTPGIVFLIELSVYLFISYFFVCESQKSDLKNVLKIFSSGGMGASIFSLIIIFGLGYVFSVIHHLLYWIEWNGRGIAVDHRNVLQKAVERNMLIFYVINPAGYFYIEKPDIEQMKRFHAHRLLTILWNEREKSSKILRSAKAKYDSISDIAHGFGTTIVASISALLVWWIIITKLLNVVLTFELIIFVPIIFLIFFGIFLWSFKRMVIFCELIVNITILNDLNHKPAKLYLTENEYKNIGKNSFWIFP